MGKRKDEDEFVKYYNVIVYRIRYHMKRLNYKHWEMAAIIGISLTSFGNKITNNGARFNVMELQKIADEMYIKVDDLLPAI